MVSLPAPTNHDNGISAWLLRLLLAALLLFGAEILLWIDPPSRAMVDWLLLAIGYVALGTLMLDLAVRYRVRDIYDIMLLAALFAVVAGLVLNPQIALADFPTTFLTRIMGAHSLLGLEMFGLFLALTRGTSLRARRLLAGFSLWVGFYWGIWMRWTPSLTDWLVDEVSVETMFTYAGGIWLFILLLFGVAVHRANSLTPSNMQVSRGTGIGLGSILVGLWAIRMGQEAFDLGLTLIALALILLCLGMLWFRRPTKGTMLMDSHLPPTPLPFAWIAGSLVIFVAATVGSYHLPLVEIGEYNQLSLMGLGYAGVGLLWLPVVAAVISIDALDRLERQSKF